jgi:hypothetical protein
MGEGMVGVHRRDRAVPYEYHLWLEYSVAGVPRRRCAVPDGHHLMLLRTALCQMVPTVLFVPRSVHLPIAEAVKRFGSALFAVVQLDISGQGGAAAFQLEVSHVTAVHPSPSPPPHPAPGPAVPEKDAALQ